MKLTQKQAKKMSKLGIWIDYFCGFPRLTGIHSNNWYKMHGLPMRRKVGK